MDGSDLAVLLTKLANAVKGKSSAELDAILDSIAQQTIRSHDAKSRTKSARKPAANDDAQLSELLSAVSISHTRDDALNVLASGELTRSALVRLAKIGNIYVSKDDSVEKIREKIIESTVGARLRSQAVRGSAS